MDKIGILLYGYKQPDALSLQKAIEEAVGRKVALLSASGMENNTLGETLEEANCTRFEENETPVLIFLGFGDEEIKNTLRIATGEKVRRPIFCSLTKENIRWPLHVLIDHLKEEDMYWKNRK